MAIGSILHGHSKVSAVAPVGLDTDGQEELSASFDRMPQGDGGVYDAVCVISGAAALAAGETLSVTVGVQESADGSTFGSTSVVQAATVILTGAGNFAKHVHLPLAAYKQYVKLSVQVDVSSTGTFVGGACLVVTGAEHTPPAVGA